LKCDDNDDRDDDDDDDDDLLRFNVIQKRTEAILVQHTTLT